YIHNLPNGKIDRGEIIQTKCSVKFYKFTPQDLTACPFIALVCIRIHNHPPPPPEKIPADIKLNFQTLIRQTINDNDIVTSGNIQSKTLSNIHQSLNNVDKLQILVAKAYKNLHLYGQDILGVLHVAKTNNSEIKNYIHRI
ncbi:20090_t:CDS:2, partial [Racocetra persica]